MTLRSRNISVDSLTSLAIIELVRDEVGIIVGGSLFLQYHGVRNENLVVGVHLGNSNGGNFNDSVSTGRIDGTLILKLLLIICPSAFSVP